MLLSYEKIIKIMDASAGYLSMDTPENLYEFLTSLPTYERGDIVEFCYNDLKYPIVDKLEKIPSSVFYNSDLKFNTWTAGSHVVQIDPKAFSYCSISTVDLSKAKITELSNDIFNWSHVKKVILPEGLKKIGSYTFWNSHLTEVYIPSTVESIGEDSFFGCTHLQKVHLCKDSILQNKLKMDQDDFKIIKDKIVLY